ncbi:MAG: prepilin-type N-terminal cleavage/methylation domain-containing protein, partial [bacterium]|nr:prepilin-type N-terminal cleavage/methylation domain-containing protein [Candidatus Colisoma equi]
RRSKVRRAFTLIELLVICAILATMVSIGVGSILSGQGAARVKGATRDVYAAIRHARSVARVTGQRVLVNYSNETVDDEVCVKIEVVAAKIMSADGERPQPTPYWVEDYKDLPQKAKTRGGEGYELVHIRKPGEGDGEKSDPSGGGETLEEILFSPMDASVIKGMRILVKKGEEALADETDVQARSRISVFSNVDYLQNRYKEAKADSAKAGAEVKNEKDDVGKVSGSVNDMDETVSVVWETNGAVEPHKIWIYPDGKKPEDGLMLNIDSFGGVKVLDGDGREED